MTPNLTWPKVRLKFLSREPLSYGANEAAVEDNPDWPRFVRITDIDDHGRLRDETFKSLSPEIAAPYMLDDGDVLFARSGATVGKSFLYQHEWGSCCHAGYLIRFRAKLRDIVPRFLSYFTQSSIYWEQVLESTIQATIQNLKVREHIHFSTAGRNTAADCVLP